MTLPRFLTHNVSWKIIAIISATLVWMTLKSGTPPRDRPRSARTFQQVPIAVLMATGDHRTVQLDPDTVEIQVSGPPEVLPRLRNRDLRAFVDVTTLTEARPLRLRVEVHLPSGIALVKVSPAEVAGQSLLPPHPQL